MSNSHPQRYPERERRPNPRYQDEVHVDTVQSLQQQISTVEKKLREVQSAQQPPHATDNVVRTGYSRLKPNLSSIKRTLFTNEERQPYPIEVVSRNRPEKKKSVVPNLSFLRGDAELNKVADSLVDVVLSEESSTDDSGSDQAKKGKRKTKRKIKSGREVKASEGVRVQLQWPHTYLRYQYVTSSLSYSELNFNLLTAGELEILSSGRISESEFLGRLNLMRILAYESHVYPFRAISEWHSAYLHCIEMGRGDWSLSPYAIGQAILARHRPMDPKSKSTNLKSGQSKDKQKKPVLWFCASYNRSRCSKESPHEDTVRGKLVQVHHVCAACWIKSSAKQSHPESSTACPNFPDHE